MAGPLAAVPWLIKAAPRLWPWLMRGKGVNLPLRKTAQGVDKVVRSATAPHTVRYTQVKPLDKPWVSPYVRPGVHYKTGRRTTPGIPISKLRREAHKAHIEGRPYNQFRSYGREKAPYGTVQDGAKVGGTRNAPTRTYPGSPAVTETLPAGYARRHPFITGGVGASVLGTGYGIMTREDEPMVAPPEPYATQEPWSAPSDLMGFAEQQKALADQGKKQLSDMLKYGFGLAAAGAKTDKFFERGMAIIEQGRAYNESKHFADVVKAVYKDGNMPKNAREAYERLTPLVGPEQASVLSGHQLGMEEGKTKEERIWNRIMEIAQYDIDGAAAELVAAWGTGRLKNAPVQPQRDIRLAKARQMIADLVGGTGLAEGIQNLERIDA
tara:strand:+ start:9883 stop:11025 length:1143 start_codon:yes stop_codon:yes gene_type:complete